MNDEILVDSSSSCLGDASQVMTHGTSSNCSSLSLVEMANCEIEAMRNMERQLGGKTQEKDSVVYHKFPPACCSLLRQMAGNSRCVDCGARHPQWASVSYGVMLCLQCSGHHRSLGVQVSCVRSLYMDEWSLPQILAMFEGGNEQILEFFGRHLLSPEACSKIPNMPPTMTPQTVTRWRYKTKAALFYRQQMSLHVNQILQSSGPYRGREMSRRRKPSLAHRNSTLE